FILQIIFLVVAAVEMFLAIQLKKQQR
ncbi:hypothetical protein ACR73N_16420, partial [Listeria monocytogenes]